MNIRGACLGKSMPSCNLYLITWNRIEFQLFGMLEVYGIIVETCSRLIGGCE